MARAVEGKSIRNNNTRVGDAITGKCHRFLCDGKQALSVRRSSGGWRQYNRCERSKSAFSWSGLLSKKEWDGGVAVFRSSLTYFLLELDLASFDWPSWSDRIPSAFRRFDQARQRHWLGGQLVEIRSRSRSRVQDLSSPAEIQKGCWQ
jgi:hypothetical protein